MATMAEIAKHPLLGALAPSQQLQDLVLSYYLETWHFVVAFVV